MTITRGQLLALDLVGPDEIGSRLGVRSSAVANWRTRFADFPRPELTISRVPAWRWETVAAWALEHGKTAEVRSGEIPAATLAYAREHLEAARAQIVREVRESADGTADLLTESLRRPQNRAPVTRGGRFVSNDGEGNGKGTWDWYWALSAAERKRLRPWFSDDAWPAEPDQWHAAMRDRLGENFELAMAEWVNATALADAVRLLESGQRPTFSFAAVTTYPLEILGADGALELARCFTYQDETEPEYESASPAGSWDEAVSF